MRFGGHETFFPRPGWLTKGLLHLQHGGPGFFSSVEVADTLGVGRNMAKSIGWWLQVAGLAHRPLRTGPLEITRFGYTVLDQDPYMSRIGTWWLVHAGAVTQTRQGILGWFFRLPDIDRFDRATLIGRLASHQAAGTGRESTPKAVQREIAVLLQAYAVPVPRPAEDPEENLGCPLHRLELLRHITATDRYERTTPTPIPPEALAVVLVAEVTDGGLEAGPSDGGMLDLSLSDRSMSRIGGLLGLSREEIAALAAEGERALGTHRMAVRHLAGERVISVAFLAPAEWASSFYDRAVPAGMGSAA